MSGIIGMAFGLAAMVVSGLLIARSEQVSSILNSVFFGEHGSEKSGQVARVMVIVAGGLVFVTSLFVFLFGVLDAFGL